MAEQGERALGTARVIASAFYLTGIVIFPAIGYLLHLTPGTSAAGTLRFLAPILLVVAIIDYGYSLFMERYLLRQVARNGVPSGVVPAAIVTAAFGVSLSIYGFVLHLLSSSWAPIFYGLCLVHGIHLAIRWPSYVQAAAGKTDER